MLLIGSWKPQLEAKQQTAETNLLWNRQPYWLEVTLGRVTSIDNSHFTAPVSAECQHHMEGGLALQQNWLAVSSLGVRGGREWVEQDCKEGRTGGGTWGDHQSPAPPDQELRVEQQGLTQSLSTIHWQNNWCRLEKSPIVGLQAFPGGRA